jgi:hypothetical protein
MKKLYICGRVTGDENYQKKFARAEAKLRAAGYTDIVNPARRMPADIPWKYAMRICLKAMMDCDGLALLPDWISSRGAQVEIGLAAELDIPRRPLLDWINYGLEENL